MTNALGSTNEIIVHLQVAQELGYTNGEHVNALIADYRIVGKQLTKLIERWR